MPVNFLSEAERLCLSRFPAPISDSVISYFTLFNSLLERDLEQQQRARAGRSLLHLVIYPTLS